MGAACDWGHSAGILETACPHWCQQETMLNCNLRVQILEVRAGTINLVLLFYILEV